MYRQNTYGILLQNICTGIEVFWDDFPKKIGVRPGPTSIVISDFLNFFSWHNPLVLSYVYSKQPILLGLTQECLRELSFSRLECGVHNKLHISNADW